MAPLVEFHPTFYGTTSPAVPVEKGRGRRMARGDPRAIVIKHRELAKLRCNLAGDVLPCGLARRGPRGCTYPHTYVHIYVYKREGMCKAARHRKVLGDIAPAIRPSFWELNFCGSRHRSRHLPSPPTSRSPFVYPKAWTGSSQGSSPFDARSLRFFLPLLAASLCIASVTITSQSRARVIYESVIYPPS